MEKTPIRNQLELEDMTDDALLKYLEKMGESGTDFFYDTYGKQIDYDKLTQEEIEYWCWRVTEAEVVEKLARKIFRKKIKEIFKRKKKVMFLVQKGKEPLDLLYLDSLRKAIHRFTLAKKQVEDNEK